LNQQKERQEEHVEEKRVTFDEGSDSYCEDDENEDKDVNIGDYQHMFQQVLSNPLLHELHISNERTTSNEVQASVEHSHRTKRPLSNTSSEGGQLRAIRLCTTGISEDLRDDDAWSSRISRIEWPLRSNSNTADQLPQLQQDNIWSGLHEWRSNSSSTSDAVRLALSFATGVYSEKHGEAQTITVFEIGEFEKRVTLNKLEHGTEFLLSCGMFKEASRLYLILCQAFQRFRPIPHRRCLLSLAAGVRCAFSGRSHTAQIAFSRLINKWLDETENFTFTVFERWFLRVLFLQVQTWRSEGPLGTDLAPFRNMCYDAPALLEGVSSLMNRSKHHHHYFFTKVHTTFYILNSLDPRFNSDHMNHATINSRFKQYIEKPSEPIPLHQKDLLDHTNHVRRCLRWILIQVSICCDFQVKWSYFRDKFVSSRDADVAVLFCFLSARWVDECADQTSPFKEFHISTDASHLFPGLEILKVLSFLILKPDIPRKPTVSDNPRNTVDRSWLLRQRALDGTQALIDESDETFMSEFLNMFTCLSWNGEMKHILKDRRAAAPISWLNSTVCSGFINKYLGLDVSDLTERCPLKSVQIKIEGYDPKTQVPMVDSPPAYAPGPFEARISMMASTISWSSDGPLLNIKMPSASDMEVECIANAFQIYVDINQADS